MKNKTAFKYASAVTMVLLLGICALGQKPSVKDQLKGYWKSSEAIVEFKSGDRITINDDEYGYKIFGSVLYVGSSDGTIEIPFKLVGDKLTVLFEGRTIVYARMTDDEIAELSEGGGRSQSPARSGGVLAELVGKWCYSANVNAIGGGRQSDICFTLKPDGTYDYHGETSNSNIYGGSSSASSDYGRWSATASTLTAVSSSGRTTTYSLEKRNHPKTGDPMLIVDGDAFVTYYQKRPW